MKNLYGISIQKFSSEFVWLVFFSLLSFNLQAQPALTDSTVPKSRISPGDFNAYAKRDDKAMADRQLDSIRKASANGANDVESAAYQKAYLAYETEALNHRHRVFEWQLSSSKYIFIVVNVIVFAGLLLSFWQFYLPIYRLNKMVKLNKTNHTDNTPEENNGTPASTIKFGKDGIEITSSVIGLLILFISIAFFFLYLHYVYPISDVS